MYSDRGVIYNGIIENEEVMKIRDILLPLLEKNFKVYKVPDHFGLHKSVKWVNGGAKKWSDGLALSLHLNSGKGNGAECFYYDYDILHTKVMAKKLSKRYHEMTGLFNRGAKPDRYSNAKYLYWIKKTNPYAILLELGFIDTPADINYIRNNREQVAMAIYYGVCDIFKIKIETEYEEQVNIKNEIAKHLGLAMKLLEQVN